MRSSDQAIRVRTAEAEDLAKVVQIERECSSAAHWQETAYRKAVTVDHRLLLVAECGEHLLGFLVASTATQEWELENIAVSPAVRRQGVGRALISTLINEAKSSKATEIRQEIRASNLAAQQLGQSVGFVQEGQRKGYYRDPTEDALLFKYLVQKR